MHGSGAVAGIGESTYYRRGESPHTEFQLACIAPGILIAGNVVGTDPAAIAIGDRVRVVLEDARDPRTGEALKVPQWQVVG